MSADTLGAGSSELAAFLLTRYGPTMTPAEVGEILRQHPTHVRQLCQTGELPGVRIGKRWHLPTLRIAKLLDAGAQGVDHG